MKKVGKFFMFLTCGLIVLLILGFSYEFASSKINESNYRAPGELVNVGENTLHLNIVGEKTTYPPIIIESGSGSFSYDWFNIQEVLAKETIVVTYDRAGYGWSEPNKTERSYNRINEELFQALKAQNIEGPYLLVGHSLGGLYMRNFFNKYPNEVAGMVLVDPRPIGLNTEFQEIDLEIAKKIVSKNIQQNNVAKILQPIGIIRLFKNQLLPEMTEEQLNTYINVSMSKKQFTAANDEIKKNEELEKTLQDQTFGQIPLTVLSHKNPMGFEAMGFSNAQAEKLESIWLEKQQETAKRSSNGKLLQVEGGHNLMYDNPQAVIQIVKEMLLDINNN